MIVGISGNNGIVFNFVFNSSTRLRFKEMRNEDVLFKFNTELRVDE